MATSLRNSRAIVGAALLACGWLGVAHGAQEPCAEAIQILADQPADIDFRNNNATLRNVVIIQCGMRVEAGEAKATGGMDFKDSHWAFSGNVRITAEGGNLKSDKATVSFRNNLISRAVVTGAPAEFEQKRKDGTLARGHAKSMEYEPGTGTVSFRDNAWLSDGCNEITGPQLVYNIRAQSVGGQPTRTTTAAPGGRIKITIQPKDAGGQKPCAKPADSKP